MNNDINRLDYNISSDDAKQEIQRKQKHRYINFRSLLVIAVFIVVSVLLGFLTFLSPVAGWVLFVAWFTFALSCSTYFWFKKATLHKILTFIIAAICSVAVFLNFVIFVNHNNQSSFLAGEVVTIRGNVDDVIRNDENIILVLTNVTHEGERVRGRMRVTVRNVPNEGSVLNVIAPASMVTVSGATHFSYILDDDMNISTRALRTGVRYRMYVNYDRQHIHVTPERAGWYRRFTMRIQQTLRERMGEDYGGLAWGILTGDRNELSDDIRFNFQNSGFGHVLAVSGLHLMLITSLLSFILGKLKIRRWKSHAIITVILFLYLFLASFSPSVIRAFIMIQVFLIGQNSGLFRDRLSSVFLAISVILLIYPLYLFDPGFMMSVGAVYSIVLFQRHIANFLHKKLRLFKKGSQFMSMTMSAQLGVVPAMIFHFSQFHTYSILLNIILMPFFMFSFSFLFVAIVLAMIMPFLGFLVTGAGYLLRVIDVVASFFAYLPFSTVIYFSTPLIALVYPSYFFLSSYFIRRRGGRGVWNKNVHSDSGCSNGSGHGSNSRTSILESSLRLSEIDCRGRSHWRPKKMSATIKYCFAKIGVVRPLAMILVLFAFFNGLIFYPRLPINNSIIPVNNFACVTSVVVYENEVHVVGDLRNFQRTRTTLRNHRLTSINSVFLTELTKRNVQEVVRLSREFRPNYIFAPFNVVEMDALAILAGNRIGNFFRFYPEYNHQRFPSNITPIFRESDGNFLAFEKSTAYANILFVGYNANYQNLTYEQINRASIIRAFAFTVAFRQRIFITNFRIWQVDIVVQPDYNFSLVDHRDMLFNFQTGELKRISSR
ncbi:MAG: ComEC family competence protein [Firmicutes bacterium]|nr:ComEC family competence protein [Bacillota bacterium]MCL2255597.1 ComEC family competence protein [Bacillota bacterium]